MKKGVISLKKWIQKLNQEILNLNTNRPSMSEQSRLLIEHFIELKGQFYKVKVAASADAKILEELQLSCYPHDAIWSESLLQRELTHNPKCLYLLVYDQDKPIAFIGTWFKKDECHISNIVTLADYQRRGIASHLITQVEKVARAHHIKHYTLEVRVSNIGAQQVYKRLGFRPGRVKYRYYSDNLENALEMAKRLD